MDFYDFLKHIIKNPRYTRQLDERFLWFEYYDYILDQINADECVRTIIHDFLWEPVWLMSSSDGACLG